MRVSCNIECLFRIVFKDLIDDLLNRVLGEIIELSGVGDTIPVLSNRQSSLRDSIVTLRHCLCFSQCGSLSGYIIINIPVIGFPFFLPLLRCVLDVTKLLFTVTLRPYSRRVVASKASADVVGSPVLSSALCRGSGCRIACLKISPVFFAHA